MVFCNSSPRKLIHYVDFDSRVSGNELASIPRQLVVHDTDVHQGANVSPHPFRKEHVAVWVGQLALGFSGSSPFPFTFWA